MKFDPTIIIALSSATGPSDRGILRLSGAGCIELAASFCRDAEAIRCGKGFHYYQVILDGLEIPVLATLYLMRAPHSYTREDMVELHLPGSQFLLSSILSTFISKENCRISEPGEFTKRAFFNGRLDLMQAESVTRLIAAKSDREYRKALEALSGRVTSKIAPLREKLFFMVRDLTVDLDFDEEIENEHMENIKMRLLEIKTEMQSIATTVSDEQMMEDEFKVILVGPVNAGKSTIFNQFAKEKIAIVSDVKGTTRDIIKKEIHWEGQPFVLLDCPGWGDAVDELDALAQAQSSITIETADLILCVLDGTIPFAQQKPPKIGQWQNRGILVVNKCDEAQVLNRQEAIEFFQWEPSEVVAISGKTSINDLENKIKQKMQHIEQGASNSVLNARQQKELVVSIQAIDLALEAIQSGIGIDAIEFEVRRSLYALSKVTGDEVDENILTSIFASFCIGK